jgi:hypothetical protein
METLVLSQWNRWVATNFHLDHYYPHFLKLLWNMGNLLHNLKLGELLALLKNFSSLAF